MVGTLRLEDCHLYGIASPADLARRLRSTVEELEALAGDEASYKVWTNRAGREVEEPKPRLQRLHKAVHKYLSRVQTPTHLHSTVRGRSYVSNAREHVGPGGTVKIDVQRFFLSVSRAAVYRFFHKEMRCAGDAAGLLAKLLTFRGHLPTGSSSSPMLAFYAFRGMFQEIVKAAERAGLKATCYVDDVTISGERTCSRLLHEVRGIIAAHGLKSHKARLFRPRRAKLVTGVIVTEAGIKLPNRRHRAIAQGFEQLKTATTPSEELAALNPLISRLHEGGAIEPVFKQRARTLEPRRRSARAALLREQAAAQSTDR